MKILCLFIIAVLSIIIAASQLTGAWSIAKVGTNSQDQSMNLIRLKGTGVRAGPFEGAANFKNWQYDLRHPLIDPVSPGQSPLACRNIYAAQAVNNGETCWNVFVGGWFNVDSCHDSISVTVTEDSFDTFNPHVTAVATGTDMHANNPSVVKVAPNEWHMVYTQLPNSQPWRNKPGYSRSSDGVNWSPNAGGTDFVKIAGYSGFANADINGANVLFQENTTSSPYLFFYDFQNTAPGIQKAVSSSPHIISSFSYQGVATPVQKIPNDLKKVNGNYVLGFHENGPQVFAQFANDSVNGPWLPSGSTPTLLFSHLDSADQFIVSLGFVVDASNTRILGALYGAGAVPQLDENRIFAAWLQRRVLFICTQNNSTMGVGAASRGVGPYTSTVMLASQTMIGYFEVYDSDFDSNTNTGGTLLWRSQMMSVSAGDVFELNE